MVCSHNFLHFSVRYPEVGWFFRLKCLAIFYDTVVTLFLFPFFRHEMQHFVNDLKGYLSNQILNVTCSVEYRQLRSEKLGFCLFVCLFDYFFCAKSFTHFGQFPCLLSEFSLAPCDSFLVFNWMLWCFLCWFITRKRKALWWNKCFFLSFGHVRISDRFIMPRLLTVSDFERDTFFR